MFDKQYLTIDMASSNIKLVSGTNKKSNLIIDGYSITPTPNGVLNNGNIINSELILTTLKDQIRNNRLKSDGLIFIISSSNVIIRLVQLPKSDSKEVGMILKHEANQFFPVDLKDYVYDFKILEDIETPDGIFTKVLLVAIPIKLVDEYMKLGEMLKIKVHAIDVPVNCVYKLVSGSDSQEFLNIQPNIHNQNYAILDIGQSTVNVSIFSKGILKNTRLLQGGSNRINSAIIETLKMDEQESERYKLKKLNLSDNLMDPELKPVKASVDSIFYGVNRFIDFYSSMNTIDNLTNIYLCGGGSKIIGIEQYAANYFGIPASFIDRGNSLVYKGSNSQQDFSNAFPLLVNAFGALVR